MSLGSWLAVAFAGLWIGTMLAIVTSISLEVVGLLVLLVVAILVIGLVFKSRTLVVVGAVGLLVASGLGIATAIAPSI